MAAQFGLVGRVAWTHFGGKLTDKDVDGYIHHYMTCLEDAQAQGKTLVGLVFHHQAAAPNAAQRKKMADLIKEQSPLLGQAMEVFIYAFDSALARGAVTAVSWLVKKPFKERVTAHADAALSAVVEFAPEADTEAVWRQMVEKVPPEQLFPRQ